MKNWQIVLKAILVISAFTLLIFGVAVLTTTSSSERMNKVRYLEELIGGRLIATQIQVYEYCYDGVLYVVLQHGGGATAKWNVTENRPYLCVSTDNKVIIK